MHKATYTVSKHMKLQKICVLTFTAQHTDHLWMDAIYALVPISTYDSCYKSNANKTMEKAQS